MLYTVSKPNEIVYFTVNDARFTINLTSKILLRCPISLKPLLPEMTLLLDRMEARIEFFLESRSLRLCLLLHTQQETHATTMMRQPTVAEIAPSTRVSDAHANGSTVLSGSGNKRIISKNSLLASNKYL